jgi:hypothetical protein
VAWPSPAGYIETSPVLWRNLLPPRTCDYRSTDFTSWTDKTFQSLSKSWYLCFSSSLLISNTSDKKCNPPHGDAPERRSLQRSRGLHSMATCDPSRLRLRNVLCHRIATTSAHLPERLLALTPITSVISCRLGKIWRSMWRDVSVALSARRRKAALVFPPPTKLRPHASTCTSGTPGVAYH